MMFPLPSLEPETQQALSSCWARGDLERYLQRWERSKEKVGTLPPELLDFAWRGLDMGCGFGKYLLRESERFPERGYLGIDKGTLRGGSMLRRFGVCERPNLFGIHGNVTPVLAQFPDAIFDQISIFYPNPWWPSKHRKKRWSYHPILAKIIALLKPGGSLILATNEAFYLAEWLFAMTEHPSTQGVMTVDYQGPICEREGRTHFETKFLLEGTACGEIRCTKTQA